MSDYLSITTAIRDSGGALDNGTLYLTLTARIVLAGGDVLTPGRKGYTVTNGVAASFAPGITEDCSIPGCSYWLSFTDSYGRKRDLGALSVPRSTGPVDLDDIITLAEV